MRIKQKEINSEEAFTRHQRIGDRELQRRQLLAENIMDLNEMFESQGYKAILGFDPPPRWSAYLAQIEVYYSRAEVERWRKIVQRLVKDFGYELRDFLDIPVSRLQDIVSIATDKEKAKDLFYRARSNTPQDWKDTLCEFTGKPTSDECIHKMSVWQICSKCGTKTCIHNE